MRPSVLFPVPLLALVALVACDTPAPPDAGDPSAAGAPTAASTPVAAEVDFSAGRFSGIIVEKIDASSYSYLRVQTGKGEVWAAVNRTDKAEGDLVSIVRANRMSDFVSPTLGRTFETIWFGTLADAVGAATGSASPGAASPDGASAGTPTPASADAGSVSVPRATSTDAHTVAEVVAGRAALAGKTVTVHGKVVKVNNGILKRNWVHVQDGSGADATRDNDLTFTSAQEVKVGDVVTATGTVAVDRDFGAGYTYDVIVEESAFKVD